MLCVGCLIVPFVDFATGLVDQTQQRVGDALFHLLGGKLQHPGALLLNAMPDSLEGVRDGRPWPRCIHSSSRALTPT